MARLSATPLDLTQLVKLSFASYPTVFKRLWPIFIFSAIVHLISPGVFKFNTTVGTAVLLGFLLLTWYLFTVILYGANKILLAQPTNYAEMFRYASQRYLFVLGGNIIFLAIFLLLGLIEFALYSVAIHLHADIFVWIIGFIVNLYTLVALYFAIPLIVLNQRPVFSSFMDSFRLVRGNWWRTFGVMLVVLILMLVLVAIGIMLTSYHRELLFTIFNFFYQLIIYPLIVATTLVVLNDLQLRKNIIRF